MQIASAVDGGNSCAADCVAKYRRAKHCPRGMLQRVEETNGAEFEFCTRSRTDCPPARFRHVSVSFLQPNTLAFAEVRGRSAATRRRLTQTRPKPLRTRFRSCGTWLSFLSDDRFGFGYLLGRGQILRVLELVGCSLANDPNRSQLGFVRRTLPPWLDRWERNVSKRNSRR